ncbi:MAG: CZB domain-containing protein, partial [Thermomicrobium sp.]|nr:CZB domain-containing protein [Thermomicrobium sp.]
WGAGAGCAARIGRMSSIPARAPFAWPALALVINAFVWGTSWWPFRQLEAPHQRLHQTAAEAVRAWNRGERERARELGEEGRRISGEIVQLLEALRTA